MWETLSEKPKAVITMLYELVIRMLSNAGSDEHSKK